MIQVKHFIDDNHLIKNDGYKNIEEQVNDFISKLPNEYEVISIKYSSVFNPLLQDIYGKNGIVQFSALVMYK